MIHEIDEQEAEDDSNAERETADDIIEEFFANCRQDFLKPGNK